MLEINSRFADVTDEKNLQIFYDSAYGKNHILNNPIHHNWQFKDNPNNKFNKKTIVICEKNSEICSHMGLFPVELKFFDSIKKATWHISFFTLEKYRGCGFGSAITDFSSKFFDFTMVLSGSDGTKKIYENQGGKDFGDLNRYVGILEKNRLENYIENSISFDELTIQKSHFVFERVNDLDSSYETFWKNVQKRFPITTNRTIDYLRWRYLQHPLIQYHFMILRDEQKILGYAVLRFEDNNDKLKAVRIVDMITFEEHEITLLSSIIEYSKSQVDFIDFFCTGSFFSKSLQELGFFNNLKENLRIPTVFNPIDLNRRPDINFFYKQSPHDNSEKNLLENIENWYFVKGDSDQDRSNKI